MSGETNNTDAAFWDLVDDTEGMLADHDTVAEIATDPFVRTSLLCIRKGASADEQAARDNFARAVEGMYGATSYQVMRGIQEAERLIEEEPRG